jgi:hypothetical protein
MACTNHVCLNTIFLVRVAGVHLVVIKYPRAHMNPWCDANERVRGGRWLNRASESKLYADNHTKGITKTLVPRPESNSMERR